MWTKYRPVSGVPSELMGIPIFSPAVFASWRQAHEVLCCCSLLLSLSSILLLLGTLGSLIVGLHRQCAAWASSPQHSIFIHHGGVNGDEVDASDGECQQELHTEVVVVGLSCLGHGIGRVLLHLQQQGIYTTPTLTACTYTLQNKSDWNPDTGRPGNDHISCMQTEGLTHCGLVMSPYHHSNELMLCSLEMNWPCHLN